MQFAKRLAAPHFEGDEGVGQARSACEPDGHLCRRRSTTGELFDDNAPWSFPTIEPIVAGAVGFLSVREFQPSSPADRLNNCRSRTRRCSKVPFDVERWREVARGSRAACRSRGRMIRRSGCSRGGRRCRRRRCRSRWRGCSAIGGRSRPSRTISTRSPTRTGSCACRRWRASRRRRIGCSRCSPRRSARRGRRRRLKELLEQAGSKKKNLADWLRDEFFKQHCALFGNRPFVWHIWDGQRTGSRRW